MGLRTGCGELEDHPLIAFKVKAPTFDFHAVWLAHLGCPDWKSITLWNHILNLTGGHPFWMYGAVSVHFLPFFKDYVIWSPWGDMDVFSCVSEIVSHEMQWRSGLDNWMNVVVLTQQWCDAGIMTKCRLTSATYIVTVLSSRVILYIVAILLHSDLLRTAWLLQLALYNSTTMWCKDQ